MTIEHLSDRIEDYKKTIKTVVDKRLYWDETVKPLLLSLLENLCKTYPIGWSTQQLKWLQNTEAINITFESFPPELLDCTNLVPAFQFLGGGALIFSQSYSGDVAIFMILPAVGHDISEEYTVDLGIYRPSEVDQKLIIEKVDEFLKRMIEWEVPTHQKKLGF
ncbi:hypothetical protein [Croceiramulus getboli]|nr:hypothetical protein P8624_09440 [Flavobacteriaceae bacterium YJPT1-3]